MIRKLFDGSHERLEAVSLESLQPANLSGAEFFANGQTIEALFVRAST